jgi:hypothetical protein
VDKFDKHVKEEVRGYLNKHVHFSLEERQEIRRRTANKSTTKKFHVVYYSVFASAVVLLMILSYPLVKTLNFNGNSPLEEPAVAVNDSEDNNMNASLDSVVSGKDTINRSREMFSNETTNNLQLSITNNPEMYKLTKASLNTRSTSGKYNSSKEISLGLSFQSKQNSFYTQIFKDEISLEDHHPVIEKIGNWSLIPESESPSDSQENKYTIAVSEVFIDHETYTIIVQTYDIHNDTYANPYSKTEILDFVESLQPESAIKNILMSEY